MKKAQIGKTKKPDLGMALQAAIAKHQAGNIEGAAQHYRAILAVAPQQPDALHYLGVAQHQLGHKEEAAQLIQQAVKLVPNYLAAQNNLGNVLKELERPQEAEAAYRNVLASQPQFAQAQNNLGVVLASQGRYNEAIEQYRTCLEYSPEFAECWHNLGNACKKIGDIEGALTAYRHSIALAPYTTSAYLSLAAALASRQRYNEALEVYRAWQKVEPDSPVVEHMIAAYSGAATPQRASDGYLQKTFDSFAETFDEVLQDLHYHAPRLAGALVAQRYGTPLASLQVLDAGCGTGLCGQYLKPYAQHLRGVDLSPGMLAKAAQRQLYDQLDQAEMTAYLQQQDAAFDLIVSCDTLIYFGAVEAVIQAASQALRSGGRLVFSVEKTLDSASSTAPQYLLHPHGRYSHRPEYLQQVLQDAGLVLESMEDIVLRLESEVPVAGLLVASTKP